MQRKIHPNWKQWPLWRPNGFRISWIDISAIVVVTTITWLEWSHTDGLVAILPITLGHFFLFCNVFRVRQNLEFTWAAFFVVGAFTWVLLQPLAWWWLVVGMSPITAVLIGIEVLGENYHGIGSKPRQS